MFFVLFLNRYIDVYFFTQQHKKIACARIERESILISITTLFFYIPLCMSQEFSPTQIATENVDANTVRSLFKLEGQFLHKHTLATQEYNKALSIAENIDDREETSVPYRRNAVYAASLLTIASLRGAQIA